MTDEREFYRFFAIDYVATGENNSTSMWWKITFKNGNQITTCGFYKWAKENGYDPSHIHKVYKGKYKKHKDIILVEKLLQGCEVF
jgi:hypothetical protein